MLKVNFRHYKNTYEKNVLYDIREDCVVPFRETHTDSDKIEAVDLVYCLEDGQYGIFAHEYRSPVIEKQGCKTVDVLACVVDDIRKKVHTILFDVKSNISAFSDDLLKDSTMLRAIGEVRDFTDQLHDGLLHKNAFMLYYKDDGFEEDEEVGIVTGNFEERKFADVADLLERLFVSGDAPISKLVEIKLKNSLRPYQDEIRRMRYFSERKVEISGRMYELQVYLLEKISESEAKTVIEISM